MYRLSVGVLTALTFFAPVLSQAQTINSKARANKTTVIYNFYQYNQETCAAMAPPRAKVKSVKNGKIKTSIGASIHDSGVCKGKTFKGVRLHYTPNRGFRGQDKASVTLLMPVFVDGEGVQSRTIRFNIDVK